MTGVQTCALPIFAQDRAGQPDHGPHEAQEGAGDGGEEKGPASELTDWRGSGMSVLEVSHRGADFIECAADTKSS